MRRGILYGLVWGVVLTCPYGKGVFAQQVTDNEAGRFEKRYERPPKAQSVQEPVIPHDWTTLEASQITFHFTGVRVSGPLVSDPRAYEAFFNTKLGSTINLADLADIQKTIDLKFAASGNPHIKLIIPPQTVRNGIVFAHVGGGFPIEVQVGDTRGRSQ